MEAGGQSALEGQAARRRAYNQNSQYWDFLNCSWNSFQDVIVFDFKNRLYSLFSLFKNENKWKEKRLQTANMEAAQCCVLWTQLCAWGELQCLLPAHTGPGKPKAISILSSKNHHPQPTGHCGGHRAHAYGCSGNGLAFSAADPIRGYFCRNLHGMKCWCHFRCMKEEAVGRDKPTTGQIPDAFDRGSMPVSLFLKLPVWHQVRLII